MILLLGDCAARMKERAPDSIPAILCDPPYGLEFMGQEWDKLTTPTRTWEVGGGFAKPGIGERQTAWPSYAPTTRYGTTNPTCAECGGRLRGAKSCSCPKPHNHWKPVGKRRKLPQDTPDPLANTGIADHLKAITEWHKVWLAEAYRVLEHGGVLGAFSGTRVLHHLARGMAEVGFADIRIEAWAYGSGFPKSLNVGKQIDRRGVDAPITAPTTPEAEAWDGWGTAIKPAWEPVIVGRKP